VLGCLVMFKSITGLFGLFHGQGHKGSVTGLDWSETKHKNTFIVRSSSSSTELCFCKLPSTTNWGTYLVSAVTLGCLFNVLLQENNKLILVLL